MLLDIMFSTIVILVDFVLLYNVIIYTNSLLSRIHVTTAHLLDIPCTLVATCMILERLEYNKCRPHTKLTLPQKNEP